MLYLFHEPRSPLRRYVERLWLVAGGQAPRLDRILPSGTVELVINLADDRVRIERTASRDTPQVYSGAVASGPYSAAFLVDAAQHAAMLGVHFRPGGAPAVLGVPSVALADRHVDLADLWSARDANALRARLCEATTHRSRLAVLEQVLIERLTARSGPHPAVQLALAAFGADGAGASVGEVTRRSGLSHRRLLTLFTRDIGLPPKQFCRIRRFQRVHASAQRSGRIDWADLALQCGFSDQAHLSNELKRLSGMTPRVYARAIEDRHHLLTGHVALT
jgi:AraC-like DNA-binding protein